MPRCALHAVRGRGRVRTTSRVVTPMIFRLSYTPIRLSVSAAMGTVELTGLEMMLMMACTHASSERETYLKQPPRTRYSTCMRAPCTPWPWRGMHGGQGLPRGAACMVLVAVYPSIHPCTHMI